MKSQARADVRALVGAVAIGSAMGLLLGASYLAGGAARTAVAHARAMRLAAAAAGGFSESTLLTEVAGMDAGALAVARRHDPFTAAGPAQRDREAALFAARLERGGAANRPLLRAALLQPVAPAAPLRMASANPLEGARELDCLSQAVYYEARGESSQGQAAVAQVVLNRVRHPAFPKSVCAVVYQGAQSRTCQFSFACDGSIRATREALAWRRAQAIAARALGGFVMADVGDATHFHVARLGGIWGSGLMQVAQVGAHVFYRFSGHARSVASGKGDREVYVPAAELPDAPIYASVSGAASPPADGAQPSLILASALTTAPLGKGGPLAPPPEPSSAPVASTKPSTTGADRSAAAAAAPAAAAKAAS